MSQSGRATGWDSDSNRVVVKLNILAGRMKAWAVKKMVRSSPHVKTGGHPSSRVSLFLLLGLFSLLPLTADDYVECADLFPDEFPEMVGLFEIPVRNLVIPFILPFLRFNPGLKNPNHPNLLEIYLIITSRIIRSTVIRI